MLSKNFSYQSLRGTHNILQQEKSFHLLPVELAQKVTTCSCLMIACALTFQKCQPRSHAVTHSCAVGLDPVKNSFLKTEFAGLKNVKLAITLLLTEWTNEKMGKTLYWMHSRIACIFLNKR